MKKILTFVIIYGAILIFAFINRDFLLEWLNHSDLSDLPLMIFLAILFGIIPIVPFSIFAGMMGAKYGILIGTAINWVGTVGASAIIFIVARYFFVEYFQLYLSRFEKVKRFDEIINRNAFVAVFFVRVIPIVPPPVVNIYSGLCSMSFTTYILATSIGKIPGMVIYAFLGNQLFTSIKTLVLGIVIYVGFLAIVLSFYKIWIKSTKNQNNIMKIK